MAQVHVVLFEGARPGKESENVLHDDASQFQFAPYGVVWWTGGFGQEAAIWPWHQVIHVMLDSGAAEEMGLRPKALADKALTI
jgi:hypothetical protein